MPGTTRLRCTTAFGGILANGKESIGGVITVAVLAGPHRDVSGSFEDGRHALLGCIESGRICLIFSPLPLGQIPECSSRHDHVAGGGTDCPRHGAHVIRSVKDHSICGQLLQHRSIQFGGWVVGFEIKG